MDLLARLRLMPPGSLVPVDFVLGELERERGGVSAGEVVADLTIPEVAEKLGRKPSTVRNWIAEGRIESYLLRGRERRVTRAALEAFLDRERAGESRPERRAEVADLGAWRRHVKEAS